MWLMPNRERSTSRRSRYLPKRGDYIKKCCCIVSGFGALKVIVVPSAVGRTDFYLYREKEWAYAIEGLKDAGKDAEKIGITLVPKALNRFEHVW